MREWENSPEMQKAIISDWLKHPGTTLVAYKLHCASKEALRRYDTCGSEEELRELQIFRKMVAVQIPKIVEKIMNIDKKGKFNIWKWMQSKVLKRKIDIKFMENWDKVFGENSSPVTLAGK